MGSVSAGPAQTVTIVNEINNFVYYTKLMHTIAIGWASSMPRNRRKVNELNSFTINYNVSQSISLVNRRDNFEADARVVPNNSHSSRPDSNRRPTHYECVALPTEPRKLITTYQKIILKKHQICNTKIY